MNSLDVYFIKDDVYFIKDFAFQEPYIFDDQTKNVFIFGKINSNHNITFKVNNLVILGGHIETTKTLSFTVNEGFYKGGTVEAPRVLYSINSSPENYYPKLDYEVIKKINAIGELVIV